MSLQIFFPTCTMNYFERCIIVFKISNNDDGQFFFLILSMFAFCISKLCYWVFKKLGNPAKSEGTVPKDYPDIRHQP